MDNRNSNSNRGRGRQGRGNGSGRGRGRWNNNKRRGKGHNNDGKHFKGACKDIEDSVFVTTFTADEIEWMFKEDYREYNKQI